MTTTQHRSLYTTVIGTSSIAVLTWSLLQQWRARQRRSNLCPMIDEDGPLIDGNDDQTQRRVFMAALQRASLFLEYMATTTFLPEFTSSSSHCATFTAKPMVGQVGGINTETKRPMLQLEPGCILKPVRTDLRGTREIAFYEALRIANAAQGTQSFTRICNVYAAFLMGGGSGSVKNCPSSSSFSGMESSSSSSSLWGTMALWWPTYYHHHNYSEEQQRALVALKQEVIAMRRLQPFTPLYHGVVGKCNLETLSSSMTKLVEQHAHEQSESYFLCLEDLTSDFVKPCVMDVKMGVETFEPDAPDDKRHREINKYPQQSEFGLRVVGMRVYDPSHPDASSSSRSCQEDGYLFFDKHYGRSLATREGLLNAFRIFLNGGLEEVAAADETTGTDSSSCSSWSPEDDASQEKSTSSDDTDDGSVFLSARIHAMANILAQLKAIRQWFERNKSFCFCASSLLIVYEGDPRASLKPELVKVKMIDFARVRRSDVGDPGYIQGLTTLIHILVELLQDVNKTRSLSM